MECGCHAHHDTTGEHNLANMDGSVVMTDSSQAMVTYDHRDPGPDAYGPRGEQDDLVALR
jgi:hypothetical protein